MIDLVFVKDYQDNDQLRKSFFNLAVDVFGINFVSWHENGFWTEKYIPYSFADSDQIIANASVNRIDMIINGERKRALQIGTVMTHPDYRNRGLSANLMNRILEEFKNEYDYMYLLANHTVLNFYPKFGFRPVQEVIYSMEFTNEHFEPAKIRKLDGKNPEDLQFIYHFSADSIPVSQIFGTSNTSELLMFYCLNVFPNDIYYLENENVILIYQLEDSEIHIFDIISKKEIKIEEILSKITAKGTYKVVFHYTPDYDGIHFNREIYNGSEILFVREASHNKFPENIKHPLISQA
ncbi:GNAT family N-acetyltransferase [Bacillus sp. FJAT-29937]|uniref:GNAT family N-acetyltransferase n=1 Tax=Bacillus sp. FJAT-29937 TaxID=1720553 RepID=UPI0008357BC5|nr:GNAT family N-acetyltransferase [Bacillus sp. FJAT-29937]